MISLHDYLFSLLLELIVGSGPEGIGADQAGLPVLLLVVVGQFRAGRCLTRTLPNRNFKLTRESIPPPPLPWFLPFTQNILRQPILENS